jgi:AmiR/NasT family two-component response regulator
MPKILKTREDFEGCHADAVKGVLSAASMRVAWQSLLDTKRVYVFDRDLAADETADGSAPDYIVVDDEQDDGTVIIKQFKLVDDPAAMIVKMGYADGDVLAKINELEGK